MVQIHAIMAIKRDCTASQQQLDRTNMEEHHPITFINEKKELLLPVAEKDFADFITSLLGKPQTIEAVFPGPFDLGVQNIEDCFHVVDQRVTQDEAALVQFSVRIIYDDGTSVLLNSIEEFKSHREVRPAISVGAQLSWTYLIKFKNKQAPEKQVIDLSINAMREIQFFDGALRGGAFRLLRGGSAPFFLRIQHTSRTWGVDIENLISGQVRSWHNKEPAIESFVHTNSGWIGFGSGVLFLSLVGAGFYSTVNPLLSKFHLAVIQASSRQLDGKVDFLLKALETNPWQREAGYGGIVGIVAVALACAIGIFISSLADNPPKSYLVLSQKAAKDREISLQKRPWTWGYFIGSTIATTVAGVFSRYLFEILLAR